ncbi:MAG: flavin-containing monooxygenase [Oleiphilaceae bacterium]
MSQQSNSAQPSIIIIGTGFGGIGMAIRLKKAGFEHVTLLEKAGRVGGTWRDNTYPGAACDVQSHFYSYSFEPKHDWSRKFGLQHELLGYMEHCVEKYGLKKQIRFNSEVAEAVFDDVRNRWTLTLTSGEVLDSQVLITATGQLNQPAWPNIEGISDFKGTSFHSADWNHDYDLKGKRVAVIGTGASAIQFVPEIAGKVASLSLFQRSAAWVLPKPDRPFKSWERTLFKAFPAWDRFYRYLIYWKNESRALAFTRFYRLLNVFARQAKEQARKQVADPQKLKQLIPDYQIGCKRILISNDWYPAINRTNVNLVTDPIEKIDSTGVQTQSGEHHSVDAIIFGTGFRASEFLSPIRVTGRAGITLNDAWQDGAVAFKGITVSGCSSWYLDANGKNTLNWPGFTFSYRFATRRVDTADYQFLNSTG